jgi:hypothetical protein
MSAAPLAPGLRPGGAAEVKGGQEPRLFDTSAAQSQHLRRLHQQREVERVCRTPRLAHELLLEIGRHHGIEDDIARRLTAYAGLDHRLLAAVGADRFPAPPMRIVGRAP